MKGRLLTWVWLLLLMTFVVIGTNGVWKRGAWGRWRNDAQEAGINDDFKWVLGVDDGAALLREQFKQLQPGGAVYIVAASGGVKASELCFALGYLLWPCHVWKSELGPHGLVPIEEGVGGKEKPVAIVFYQMQIKPPDGLQAVPLGPEASVVFLKNKL
ncbi:MAG: hypothetical protein QM796_08880 [Chthoniobacteraceae bacterium]